MLLLKFCKTKVHQSGRRLAAALAALLLLVTLPCLAGSRVDPVVLEIDARGRGQTTITNITTAPLGFEVTPLDWKVIDGEDELTPSEAFVATPPSFQLEPGESRTVRVGFRNQASSPVERAYRLSVREIPQTTLAEGLTFVFNHMLPAYIAPASRIVGAVFKARGKAAEARVMVVRVENSGNKRESVRSISVTPAGGAAQTFTLNERNTVLAQNWREWRLELPFDAAQAQTFALDLISGRTERFPAGTEAPVASLPADPPK